MIKKLLHNFLLFVLPPILALLIRLWFCTCRLKVHNPEIAVYFEDPDRTSIASFWHYSIIYLFYFSRKYPITLMVSASSDGEYITRVAKSFGFDTVRGSKNHKGTTALKAMLRVIRLGNNTAVVADGSQGPARFAQPGAIFLAAKTGVPIIPMAWSASSYFTVKSWDRTVIPKPFSRISFFYGKPLFIPKNLTQENIERYRLRLEERLNKLYGLAWQQYKKNQHQ